MAKESKEAVEERKQFIRDYVKNDPLLTTGADLYAELNERYPHVSAGGHRGMVGRVLGELPWTKVKTCPVDDCDTEAAGMEEALAKFGHRYGRTALQSYCKNCRNRKRREARARRRAEREEAQLDIEEEIEKAKEVA